MRVNGFIESLVPQQVSGWACDETNFDRRLAIAVMLRGDLLVRSVADLPRPDLKQAGFGTGEFGFVAKFPIVLSLADLDVVEVFAEGQDGERTRINHLAKRRSIAVKQEAPASRPVFILGSRRSGTSAVTHALLRHTRYRGNYEGHVFDLLTWLLGAVRNFYSYKADLLADPNLVSMIAATPIEYFEGALADIFRQLADKMIAAPFWLDKTPTPDMVRAAPVFAGIWPEARFIFMRRRAFENLRSQRRKFPHETFAKHCTWWSSCMSAWLNVRQELSGRAIEIDQYLLAHDPGLAASLIAEALSLEPDEHDGIRSFLTNKRPERTEVELDTIENGAAESWSDADKQFFNETCLPLFAPFGYARTADYFVSRDTSLAWRKI